MPRPGDKVFRTPRVKPSRVALEIVPKRKGAALTPMVLVYGFVGIIALGTILLMLPISSKTGHTSFVHALFTATSATCVTGLSVVNTGTYWSPFGQWVIITLIQLGGFGFMTTATLFLIALGRRFGLRERMLISESMGIDRLGGLVRLIKRIAIFTLAVEGVGAALFFIRFSTDSSIGMGTAAWRSVFHSVSAFNNCGLDIFGNARSLLDYQGDVLVILVTAVLIFLGGISFIVLADVSLTRRFTRLSLDTKIVLITSVSLLVLGTIVILATEYSNPATLGPLPVSQKLLVSFFQSVTPRTAGFAAVDIGSMASFTLFFTIILMFIGGASGSTAGGVKVNTFGLLTATVWSLIRRKEHPGAFGKEFTMQQVQRALTIVMISLGLVVIVVLILSITEKFGFLNLLFETVSAFGTVGLSTGITPELSTAGLLILTATMFIGRLGPLALAFSLVQRQQPSKYRYPQENIRLG